MVWGINDMNSVREREERRGAFSLTRDGATMDTFQSATTLKPPA